MGYSAEAFRRALSALSNLRDARGLAELRDVIAREAQALGALYFRIVEVWLGAQTVERFEALLDTAPETMTLAALLARHADYADLTFGLLHLDDLVEPEAHDPDQFASLKQTLRDEHVAVGARHWVFVPLSRGDARGGFAAFFFGDQIEDGETLKPYLRLFAQSAFDHLAGQPVLAIDCLLTPRQREALQEVAAGKSDWDIAVMLGVSQSTRRISEHGARAYRSGQAPPRRAHARAGCAACLQERLDHRLTERRAGLGARPARRLVE